MKRSKGFTLIELLAVIVILAVIALIAVPQILKILEKARLSAAEDTTYGIVKSAENYVTEFMLQNNGNFASSTLEFSCSNNGCELQNIPSNTNIQSLEKLNFKGTKPASGIVKISDNGKTVVAKDLIINGFTCNYPVDGKAKCKSQGEATEITNVDIKFSGNGVEIFADANGTVNKYEYAISETPVAEEDRKNLSYSSNNKITGLTNNKTYYVYVKITAGNNVIIKETSFEFKIPSAEIIVENETDWTNNKNVTIKYPSGEYEKSYKILAIDGSTVLIEETKVTDEEITLPIDVNCIITAIVKSGESSQPISKEVTMIDTTLPTVSAKVNLLDVTLTMQDEDNGSGIGSYCIANTNDSSICTFEETSTLTITKTLSVGKFFAFAKDNAGNISEGKEFTIEDPYVAGAQISLGGYNWHIIGEDDTTVTLFMDGGQLSSQKHCTNDSKTETDCGASNSRMQYSWDKSLIRTYLNGTFLTNLEASIGSENLMTTDICIDPSTTDATYSYGGYLKSEIESLGVTCNNGYVSDKVRLITISEYYNLSPIYSSVSLPYTGIVISNSNSNTGKIAKIDSMTRVTDTSWFYPSGVNGMYRVWTMGSFSYSSSTSTTNVIAINTSKYDLVNVQAYQSLVIRPVITVSKDLFN